MLCIRSSTPVFKSLSEKLLDWSTVRLGVTTCSTEFGILRFAQMCDSNRTCCTKCINCSSVHLWHIRLSIGLSNFDAILGARYPRFDVSGDSPESHRPPPLPHPTPKEIAQALRPRLTDATQDAACQAPSLSVIPSKVLRARPPPGPSPLKNYLALRPTRPRYISVPALILASCFLCTS